MGARREKIAVSRMSVDMTRFSPRPGESARNAARNHFRRTLNREKGLHVAIEALAVS